MADHRQKSSEIPSSESAALEERIRRYVDQRLGDTAERLLAPPGFYARYRVELWAFLILFTLAAQWLWLIQRSLPARSAAPPPAAAPSSIAPPPAVPAAATAAPGATGASAPRLPWADWVRANPQLLKAGLDQLLAEEGVKKGSLSARQRTRAAELRSDLVLAKTANLDTVHLGRLLFEYVGKRAQGDAATGQIDAAVNDSEYSLASLQKLAAELGVPAAAAQMRKEEFQQQLVIAWLEKNLAR